MGNRRKFVKTSAGWILACEALVTLGAGAGCSGGGDDGGESPTPTPGPTPVGGILTLPLASYPGLQNVGDDQVFNISGTGLIIVAQIAEDEFVCVGASCPHSGGTLFWDEGDGEFQCPLHGSTFEPDGTRIQGLALTNVPSYPTTFDGTNVVIDLS